MGVVLAWLGFSTVLCDVLETKQVKLDLRSVTLETALENLARQADFTVRIETSAQPMREKKITLIVDKPLKLKTAIALVVTYAGLHYMIQDDRIVVFKTLAPGQVRIKRAKPDENPGGGQWVARTYDVRQLVAFKRWSHSPWYSRRIGTYQKTGGHPTYIDGKWGEIAVIAGSGELYNYDNLYGGLNEAEYERAVMLNKARSLVNKIMNTINPGMWAPPVVHEEVTELVAPELAGVPPQEAIEKAVAAGKTGIITYRDGQLTILVKKGTKLQTTYLESPSTPRITTQGGIGIKVGINKSGYLAVEHVSRGLSGHIAGLKKDDIIMAVDGKSIEAMTLRQVATLIKGRMGTKVVLDIIRGTPPERKSFEVVRAPIGKKK